MKYNENLTTNSTYLADYTLLFDTYLLPNLSLRVATVTATSLTPNIFKHSAAISEVGLFWFTAK